MGEQNLQRIAERLYKTLESDVSVQETTNYLRNLFGVDRVVLYYFYKQWKGQVTFESLSSPDLSIFGMTGADDCFNDEYAAMYLAGRVKAIADVESAQIHSCHKDFLRSIKVRASLVVPVLTSKGLWGLLVAHHCRGVRSWSPADIKTMQNAAATLANSAGIRDS